MAEAFVVLLRDPQQGNTRKAVVDPNNPQAFLTCIRKRFNCMPDEEVTVFYEDGTISCPPPTTLALPSRRDT